MTKKSQSKVIYMRRMKYISLYIKIGNKNTEILQTLRLLNLYKELKNDYEVTNLILKIMLEK